MDDVNILNAFEVVTKEVFGWESFWWGALVGVGIGLIVTIGVTVYGTNLVEFFVDLGVHCIVAGLIVGVLAGTLLAPKPVEYETHYEVSIGENVNMQEFMNTYEIIETRGSIYTVREK